MAQVLITRKFRLDNLNIPGIDDLFVQYRDLVNKQINLGLQLPSSVFDNDSLVSVKKFYRQLPKQQCDLKERVHRCGSQLSYFAVKEYRRNQRNLIEIINIQLRNGFFYNSNKEILENTDLSYFEIDNKLNFINNKLIDRLKGPDLQLFFTDGKEQKKYQLLVNNKLNDNKFIVDTLKSFKQRAVRRLNKRFRELQQSKSSSRSNYDSTIVKMLNLSSIADVVNVGDKQWSRAKIAWKQDLDNSLNQLVPNLQINNWGRQFDNVRLLLLKPGNDRLWINGASFTDLLKFIDLEFDILLREQIIAYLKINYLKVINHELQVILKDLNSNTPDILKIPELNKSSIPLGIDDGQVYRLKELDDRVEITLSLIANEFVSTDLRTVDRYEELIKLGFKSQRGVLNFSRGKYYIYIPFTKKASEERDGDLTASADLGLKTLATLSVYKKTKEIDRQFLDQKNMGGKKDDWFVNPKSINIKSKLMDRRLIARDNQSMRMKSKKGTMKHWFARDRQRTQWRKIKNSNLEIIRQLSARTISYLNYHGVGTLVLENMKWSRHGARSKVGYFLATWQVHWFFSQVQTMLINQCKLHGIHVELVDPRNSSKICSKCSKIGKRQGKQFYCSNTSCSLKHVDSDLNAARNLIQRSKRYKHYQKLLSDAIS